MAELIRDAFMVPRTVRDALLGDFPPEVFCEVICAIDDYARYWEIHQTGEGFDISDLSPVAKVAFKMVYKTITEYNSRYLQKVLANSWNASSGWEKRRGADERNRRRREAYAAKKGRIKEVDCSELAGNDKDDATAAGRNERVAKKEEAVVDNMGVSSDFMDDEELSNGDETMTKAVTKTVDEALSSNGLSESMRSHGVIGFNNNLVKHSVVIEERGCGGKQVIHRPVVDNPPDNHPSDGLTGNNPAAVPAEGSNRRLDAGNKPDPPDADPAAESAGKPKPDALAAMGKGQWEAQAFGLPAEGREMPETGNVPPEGGNKRPPTRPSPGAGEGESSASVHVRGGGWDKDQQPKRWPAGDEVVILPDFRLDFLDPKIADLNFLDDFLIRGVEDKLKAWKTGRSVEKWWIRRLIFRFAENQGRTESLSAELLRRARLKQGGADDGS